MIFLLLLAFLSSKSVNTLNDVTSFSIKTRAHASQAGTPNTVYLTLWFNFTIYQHALDAPESDTWYTASKEALPTFVVLGESECHKPDYNNIPEAKIMIENDHDNAVQIDKIQVNTSSASYGMDKFYADNVTLRDYLCIDNQNYDCGPYKKILYFDTTRPNEYLNDVRWIDGTSVTPDIKTCHPTKYPTVSPTHHPTQYPTNDPSILITTHPTLNPTNNPTDFPTNIPSTIPSDIPTMIPTKEPSNIPSKQPTDNPSQHPSNLPAMSTVSPTKERDAAVKEAFSTTSDDVHTVTAALNQRILNNSMRLLLILVAITLCICCAVFLLRLFFKKRKQENITPNIEMETMEGPPTSKRYYEAALVAEWVEKTLKLPIYSDMFINNGYNTMSNVAQIESKSELNEIGIMDKKHQTQIISEIKRLRDRSVHQTQGDTKGLLEMDMKPLSMIDVASLSSESVKEEDVNMPGSVQPKSMSLGSINDQELSNDEFIVEGDDEKMVTRQKTQDGTMNYVAIEGDIPHETGGGSDHDDGVPSPPSAPDSNQGNDHRISST